MQVLVLNENRRVQEAQATALLAKGFSVVRADNVAAALSEVRKGAVDVLVMADRVQGRLSHVVALTAKCHNPRVATLLLTGRIDPEMDDLFELWPSLHAILGLHVAPDVVARLAFTSMSASIRAQAPQLQHNPIRPVARFASRHRLDDVA